jgi:hypothetical protein
LYSIAYLVKTYYKKYEITILDGGSPRRLEGANDRLGKAKETAMGRTKQEEVDRNFEFFQKELPSLLENNRGKFALIRDAEIKAFYDTIVDAQTIGNQLFSDGLFSIQRVYEDAVDLGFFSHAMHMGSTQRFPTIPAGSNISGNS